jgi:hypothetical protein
MPTKSSWENLKGRVELEYFGVNRRVRNVKIDFKGPDWKMINWIHPARSRKQRLRS